MTRGRPDGIVAGRDVALGLVHGEVDHLLELDLLAIHGDDGCLGIDLRPELAHDLAVDGDPALEDVFLAIPARAQPRMRQDLLEALGLAARLVLRTRGRLARPLGFRLPPTRAFGLCPLVRSRVMRGRPSRSGLRAVSWASNRAPPSAPGGDPSSKDDGPPAGRNDDDP